jgi:spore maturation protein CgeB
MKVLLVGYHNPNFVNTITYRMQALLNLGHEVVFFNDLKYIIPGRIRSKFPALHRWDVCRINDSLVKTAQQMKPDVCLIVGGQTIASQTVQRIKEKGIRVGLWTTDVPIDFETILEAAPFYDHLFCAGSEALDIFQSKGFKHTTLLPFACAPSYHKPLSLSASDRDQYGKDIVFVGSFYPNRAKVLESIADYHLGVWGPYWEKLSPDSPLRPKAVNIKMNYDVWVKIFNASKINIVIHYNDGVVPCYQISPKLFEALACGCFVLTDQQKDVKALFKDKEHVVFFKDENDLRSKIDYYLEHPEERLIIAQKGHEEVLAKHTYEHRLKEILSILK